MNNTGTLEKLIEAEHAAQANLKELEAEKKAYEAETERMISEMRKAAFEKADEEIEKEKTEFLAIWADRVAKEREKSEKAAEEIAEKKRKKLGSTVEKSFLEIIGDVLHNG